MYGVFWYSGTWYSGLTLSPPAPAPAVGAGDIVIEDEPVVILVVLDTEG